MRLHGLLLAAGGASRMGAPKLLLPAPEGTLLRRMALLLRQSVPGEVVVVLGHEPLLHRRALEGVRGIRLAVCRISYKGQLGPRPFREPKGRAPGPARGAGPRSCR
jgi:CTP:molybdopterin cytidylyltransferase MocA